MQCEGRVALITGSSRGIGAAIALAFAQEGADVALNCYEAHDELLAVRDSIRALGRKCTTYYADVADHQGVVRMVEGVHRDFGRIDILVNNAGIAQDKTLRKMSEEEWRRVIDVNLTGTFHCSQSALPVMLEQQSGCIISIASVVALTGNFGQTNYAASKAGIIGFTKSLAREVAAKGIRVNAVAPGFIKTAMIEAMPEEQRQKVLAQIPSGRFGLPEDIARGVLFLASDAASYITGTTLNINGGLFC